MRLWKPALIGALSALCCACTSDKVIFVTSTSLGINVDTTPGTVSLAYDRTEGYVAPSYQSGTLPPVIAGIDTDGQAIAPEIRQLYATGPAAIIVGGGTATEPATMTRRTGKLAFVGTTTTVGIKAAFTTGAPESFNFGYKRKEFSYIPLGCQVPGQTAPPRVCPEDGIDLYPSAIGSFDTAVSIPSPSGTTFTTRQFIATGAAATALAPSLKPDFQTVAKESVAFQTGRREAALHSGRLEKVAAYVAPGGTFDQTRLHSLVDTANANKAGAVYPAVRTATSVDELKAYVGADQALAKALEAAIPQGPNN